MQRDENAHKERFVLVFERERETVDDRSEDLQKFCDALVAFRLVDEMEEDIVDTPSDRRAEVEELAVYPMQRRLEEVTFPRVL